MRKNTWKGRVGRGGGVGPSGDRWRELNLRQIRAIGRSPSPNYHNSETAMFISMSQELKEEGNRWFLMRDYEGALIKYDKAIKLLPSNHPDIACIRCNMAECYMQMGRGEYSMAIRECDAALEAEPGYSKALLKRARCYEAMDRIDMAIKDIENVLKVEPNNLMATEIEQRLKKALNRQGSRLDGGFSPLDQSKMSMKMKAKEVAEEAIKGEFSEAPTPAPTPSHKDKEARDVLDKHKSDVGVLMSVSENLVEEKNTEDKVVVEEKMASTIADGEPRVTLKLVFGEDIRMAQASANLDILRLGEIISNRFPSVKGGVVKYKDQEGDFVIIATTEELRWAQSNTPQGTLKLYIFEGNQNRDRHFLKSKSERIDNNKRIIVANKKGESLKEIARKESTCIADWIIQFAQFFKNYVGFDIDAYIDIHEVGMKLYSEAMEETITSEEAQELLSLASEKFLEMAALALFNCGNVHMSRARKRVYDTGESSRDSMAERINRAHEWAQNEFATAGQRYEEALQIKESFYEAVLALGQQQFEQAKLSWYYAISAGVDVETWDSGDVFMLYDYAEANMEKGMKMWEEEQKQRVRDRYKKSRIKSTLKKMKIEGLFQDISPDEVEDQATNFRSQIYVLWGTIMYERSMMEYKLGCPVWEECLEDAIEKFDRAGASKTDISVMIKNHCSTGPELEGMGFNIDEIVQAWNEMYEAKKWQHNVSSFRLEPLLRRRVSKLYRVLEHT
ncbi:protein PHOX1-like [Andrographis paniculata]|uniref:protein PHOX1-like n=1 Tax=Andrographis paniculata TaxID=175694 RepID=UPI0021E70802|nr:protein PHOX1-like [Andrographis paniculata]